MGRGIKQRKLQGISIVSNAVGAIAFTLFGVKIPDNAKILIGEFVVGLLGILVTPLVTSFMQVEVEAVSAALTERRRALGLFVEIAHKLMELDSSHELRVTLLEVDKNSNPPMLRQLVRCTDKGKVAPGDTGMTIQQGVAGRCYRNRKNVTFNVTAGSGSDFVQHMLDLGFPDKEAKQFKERGAYLCSPIFDGNDEVIAVLSLDTKTPDAFTPNHTETTEWLTPFFSKFLTQPETE